MKNILKIANLTIHFHVFDGVMRVLDGVDIEVYEGESISLVGETGCGKSVTMKTVLRILPIPPGRIVDGKIIFKENMDLLSLPEEEFFKLRGREIAFIPQEPSTSLNPVFTIGEQFTDLILFQGLREVKWSEYYSLKKDKERVKEAWEKAVHLLEKVQIPDPERVMRSYPVQLSGGMRQRVLIAMALSGSPSLLIADEPTTALDVTTQDQIIKLIKERILRENLSTIYVTHNLGVARQIAKRIFVMYAGTVVEKARVSDLFKNPLHPYTEGLLASIPKLTGSKLIGIPGMIPDYINPPKGCRFYPRCNYRKEVCKEVKPKMVKVDEEHFVACHLYQGS